MGRTLLSAAFEVGFVLDLDGGLQKPRSVLRNLSLKSKAADSSVRPTLRAEINRRRVAAAYQDAYPLSRPCLVAL